MSAPAQCCLGYITVVCRILLRLKEGRPGVESHQGIATHSRRVVHDLMRWLGRSVLHTDAARYHRRFGH